jgi:hypothetical protein
LQGIKYCTKLPSWNIFKKQFNIIKKIKEDTAQTHKIKEDTAQTHKIKEDTAQRHKIKEDTAQTHKINITLNTLKCSLLGNQISRI